jgi:hypothetical protein
LARRGTRHALARRWSKSEPVGDRKPACPEISRRTAGRIFITEPKHAVPGHECSYIIPLLSDSVL